MGEQVDRLTELVELAMQGPPKTRTKKPDPEKKASLEGTGHQQQISKPRDVQVAKYGRVKNGKIQVVGEHTRGGPEGSADVLHPDDGKVMLQLRQYRRLLADKYGEEYAQRQIEGIRSTFRASGSLDAGRFMRGLRRLSDGDVEESSYTKASTKREMLQNLRTEYRKRKKAGDDREALGPPDKKGS